MKSIRIWEALAASAIVIAGPPRRPLRPPTSAAPGPRPSTSQVGKQTYTYMFKVDGGKLTGHSKSNLGESDLTGAVDNDKVTFVENLNYQDQPLAITYTGQIVSADEIKFKRDVAARAARSSPLPGRNRRLRADA